MEDTKNSPGSHLATYLLELFGREVTDVGMSLLLYGCCSWRGLPVFRLDTFAIAAVKGKDLERGGVRIIGLDV